MQPQSQELRQAYRECRYIARTRAKNFYYAFLALRREKRDAICAVYAFMRQADDLADDDSIPIEQRRSRMREWTEAWRAAESSGQTGSPVLLALRDAQQRFRIPSEWLAQLVQGTTLDLDPQPQKYVTVEDLSHYCYLVASVVGLVCIRIFGYSDPRAEQFAEETGLAFQLTNILRDVAEDASLGRVYIPAEVLARHGLAPEDVVRGDSPQLRGALAEIAALAERSYAFAQQLLPLIDTDARPALKVLVTIYHRLLRKIQNARFDVFSERIKVPPFEKTAILLQGLAMAARQKIPLP